MAPVKSVESTSGNRKKRSSPETQRVDGIENEKESHQPLLVSGERKFPCLPTVLNGTEGGKREPFFFRYR